MQPLRLKCGRKCNPFVRNCMGVCCIKHTTSIQSDPKMQPLHQKCGRKCNLFARNCDWSYQAYNKHTLMLKMQPLHQKCRRKCNPFVRNCVGTCCFERCRKSHPFTRNSVENATPQAEMQRRNAKNHTPPTKSVAKMRPLRSK